MVVGAISSRTDLAVIGSGPGGYVAALRAADAGLDVTLIERDQLGGACLNVGCIPSKALIELGSTRQSAIEAQSVGLRAEIAVDGALISQHLAATSSRLRDGVTSLLNDAGVTVIKGSANFARYDRLSIQHDDLVSHIEFDNCIVATGARPIELPGLPFDGTRVMSSTGALALTAVPASMIIIGAGYIGVEIGTAWAKLGVAVTLLEAAPRVLPDIPKALAKPVERRLRELGVAVHTNVRVTATTSDGVSLADGATMDGDIIVVAVGRRPNTDQVSFDTLGVGLTNSGHVEVDHQMRAASGIYAIGDLIAGPALAHRASAHAEVAVDAILGKPATFASVIPAVIFSDPEILTVGVGLDEAEKAGLAVHTFPHAASARARTMQQTAGATSIVSDQQGTVLGVHGVGPHVSELAGEATLAIEMAATVEDVARTVHAHPTISESIAEAAWMGLGEPLHVRR